MSAGNNVARRKAAGGAGATPEATSGGAATASVAERRRGSSSLAKLLVLLLAVAVAGGGLWFQVALSDKERVEWRGRVKQQLALLFPAKLTPSELAKFDGSDPSLPIYLGIGGEIFDVSEGKGYYAKGGGYEGFSGRDATKAYFDLCFSDECLKTAHCTNLLTDAQRKELGTWMDFYRNEPKYPFVGFVQYDGNPPAECIAAEKAAAIAAALAAESGAAQPPAEPAVEQKPNL